VKGEKPKHPQHQQDNKQREKHLILQARSSAPLLGEHVSGQCRLRLRPVFHEQVHRIAYRQVSPFPVQELRRV
jgi:hypothetical protein